VEEPEVVRVKPSPSLLSLGYMLALAVISSWISLSCFPEVEAPLCWPIGWNYDTCVASLLGLGLGLAVPFAAPTEKALKRVLAISWLMLIASSLIPPSPARQFLTFFSASCNWLSVTALLIERYG